MICLSPFNARSGGNPVAILVLLPCFPQQSA